MDEKRRPVKGGGFEFVSGGNNHAYDAEVYGHALFFYLMRVHTSEAQRAAEANEEAEERSAASRVVGKIG